METLYPPRFRTIACYIMNLLGLRVTAFNIQAVLSAIQTNLCQPGGFVSKKKKEPSQNFNAHTKILSIWCITSTELPMKLTE